MEFIVFDLDGTLVATSDLEEGFRQVCLGWGADPEQLDSVVREGFHHQHHLDSFTQVFGSEQDLMPLLEEFWRRSSSSPAPL